MNHSSGKQSKKQSTNKTVLILCLAVLAVLLLAVCISGLLSGPSVPAEQETVRIEIKTPSSGELTIAPGRHFKVSGQLSGRIPDNATLRVMLLDAAGNEMRYAETDQKGTDRVIPSVIGGDISLSTDAALPE